MYFYNLDITNITNITNIINTIYNVRVYNVRLYNVPIFQYSNIPIFISLFVC
jgi:hypothetical protein